MQIEAIRHLGAREDLRTSFVERRIVTIQRVDLTELGLPQRLL